VAIASSPASTRTAALHARAHVLQDVPAYKVSKAALNRGTRLLASGALKGVARVNAVDPGWCKTDM